MIDLIYFDQTNQKLYTYLQLTHSINKNQQQRINIKMYQRSPSKKNTQRQQVTSSNYSSRYTLQSNTSNLLSTLYNPQNLRTKPLQNQVQLTTDNQAKPNETTRENYNNNNFQTPQRSIKFNPFSTNSGKSTSTMTTLGMFNSFNNPLEGNQINNPKTEGTSKQKIKVTNSPNLSTIFQNLSAPISKPQQNILLQTPKYHNPLINNATKQVQPQPSLNAQSISGFKQIAIGNIQTQVKPNAQEFNLANKSQKNNYLNSIINRVKANNHQTFQSSNQNLLLASNTIQRVDNQQKLRQNAQKEPQIVQINPSEQRNQYQKQFQKFNNTPNFNSSNGHKHFNYSPVQHSFPYFPQSMNQLENQINEHMMLYQQVYINEWNQITQEQFAEEIQKDDMELHQFVTYCQRQLADAYLQINELIQSDLKLLGYRNENLQIEKIFKKLQPYTKLNFKKILQEAQILQQQQDQIYNILNYIDQRVTGQPYIHQLSFDLMDLDQSIAKIELLQKQDNIGQFQKSDWDDPYN